MIKIMFIHYNGHQSVVKSF